MENLDAFLDFERVADLPSERLIHICEQRDNFLSHAPPVSTISWASYSASARFFMNAPLPVFTSSTSASIPSAIFLLMIEAQIRKGLSTVAVTSRRA